MTEPSTDDVKGSRSLCNNPVAEAGPCSWAGGLCEELVNSTPRCYVRLSLDRLLPSIACVRGTRRYQYSTLSPAPSRFFLLQGQSVQERRICFGDQPEHASSQRRPKRVADYGTASGLTSEPLRRRRSLEPCQAKATQVSSGVAFPFSGGNTRCVWS
jgi:hypothetical protein